MKPKIKKILNISAKILAIIYIALLTMLAFDVPILSLGFLIHLTPTFIFTGCLIIAWLKPKIGAVLFALAGIGTIIVFHTYRDWVVFAIISLIPIIIGILFFLSNKKH